MRVTKRLKYQTIIKASSLENGLSLFGFCLRVGVSSRVVSPGEKVNKVRKRKKDISMVYLQIQTSG